MMWSVQLLDLMGRQRRDVVPKCARHSQSELMFCETCDVVFCVDCAGASHAGASVTGSPALGGGGTQAPTAAPGTGTASAHTVIPFSIAIKRMSEILLYKVHPGIHFHPLMGRGGSVDTCPPPPYWQCHLKTYF